MSAKDAQKRRSQARAAKKRAKSKPGLRRAAEMTPEMFQRMSAPVALDVDRKLNVSVEEVEMTMQAMAEEGCLGLDAQGDLVPIKAATERLLSTL
jgi:hypothetical protein